jgi:phosphotransferase system HPr (HPr) family protein
MSRAQNVSLTPADLKAIEEHKYFLSQQRGAEVSIDEAIEDFLKRFAEDWRKEKLRRDNLDQRSEIEKHKYFRSLEEGRDVGKAAAAEEWCQKYAHIWRAERESLERNGFQRIIVVAQNLQNLHMRPWSKVAQLASRFDCDIYVHKEGMPYWNFVLEGRPYMNVKSVIGYLSLGIIRGDTLEFIATGTHAAQALEALSRLMAEMSQDADANPGT